MKLRSLQYLVALAEHKHFSKAANACFVSQPTLSMQLQKLEDELGVALIERNNKHVILTSIGEEITKRARSLLLSAQEIKKLAKNTQDPLSGTLTLGLIPTLAPYLLPLITPIFKKKFPNIQLLLIEEKTEILANKIKGGEIDAALLALPLHDHNLSERAIFKEPFLLAVPSSHPWCKKPNITMQLLQKEPLLLLAEGHCLREQALSFCQEQQNSTFKATSLETLRYMIAADEGSTLMPQLACHRTAGIQYLAFKKPIPSRDIGLIYRSITTRSKLFDAIIEAIKQRLSQHDELHIYNS